MSRTKEQIKEGEELLASGLKRCTSCADIKGLVEFFAGRGLGGVRAKCKPCYTTQTNAWRDSHIERVRELSKKENLTPDQLERSRQRGRRHYQKYRERLVVESRSWKANNPDKVIAWRTAYRAKEENRKQARKYSAAWRAANPELVVEQEKRRDKGLKLQQARQWKKRNPDKLREYARKAISTPDGKIRNRVRARVRECLRRGKGGGRTFEILGYTPEDLRAHLERQFLKGMSWENMADWHIDHIVPLSSFDFGGLDDAELRRAWALPNLRPLWARENVSKGAKRLTLL